MGRERERLRGGREREIDRRGEREKERGVWANPPPPVYNS